MLFCHDDDDMTRGSHLFVKEIVSGRRFLIRSGSMYHIGFRTKVLILLATFIIGVIIFQHVDILGVVYTINYLVHKQAETKVLCPAFAGGLGNMMFQYASAYGIARSKNMTLLIDAECELNEFFNLSAMKLPHVACWFLTMRNELRPSAFDRETLNFSANRNYQMKGYFQSWRYFDHAESALRRIFKFKAVIREEAGRILREAIEIHEKRVGSRALTFIAIHIRRGDITNDNFKTYGYTTASLDYIRKSMQYFGDRYHRVLYMVCSNDMGWAKKYLSDKNIYFVENRPREVDMAVMASCNHTIMTVGSFGWWSAWLANGEVVYYRYPASRGSALRKVFSKEMTDYYYSKWKPML